MYLSSPQEKFQGKKLFLISTCPYGKCNVFSTCPSHKSTVLAQGKKLYNIY